VKKQREANEAEVQTIHFFAVLHLSFPLYSCRDGLSQDSVPAVSLLPGESKTLLSNGSYLLLGGLDGRDVQGSASVLGPSSAISTSVSTHLDQPRALHTASVLHDGLVAIIGSVTPGGKSASEIERFDPTSETISILHIAGGYISNRRNVLIVGGISALGKILGDAQLLNPQNNSLDVASP